MSSFINLMLIGALILYILYISADFTNRMK